MKLRKFTKKDREDYAFVGYDDNPKIGKLVDPLDEENFYEVVVSGSVLSIFPGTEDMERDFCYELSLVNPNAEKIARSLTFDNFLSKMKKLGAEEF